MARLCSSWLSLRKAAPFPNGQGLTLDKKGILGSLVMSDAFKHRRHYNAVVIDDPAQHSESSRRTVVTVVKYNVGHYRASSVSLTLTRSYQTLRDFPSQYTGARIADCSLRVTCTVLSMPLLLSLQTFKFLIKLMSL